MQHQNASTRLDDAKKVEKTIYELGQMFSKMASLVTAQAEVSACSSLFFRRRNCVSDHDASFLVGFPIR